MCRTAEESGHIMPKWYLRHLNVLFILSQISTLILFLPVRRGLIPRIKKPVIHRMHWHFILKSLTLTCDTCIHVKTDGISLYLCSFK